MSVEIRRGSDRLLDRHPGRATWHSFSFGAHHDPDQLGFGPMVCHDDHRLSLGAGFPRHQHQGLVIVTWVLSGTLRHQDTSGAEVDVTPGSVAVLSTGSGVEHSEVAAAAQTRFVQVWLSDTAMADEPAYAVTPVALLPGTLTEVVRPLPGSTFAVARLGAGDAVTLPEASMVHAFVARGALARSSLADPLHAGDAFEITGEPAHQVTAAVPAELLVWSFEPRGLETRSDESGPRPRSVRQADSAERGADP